MICPVCHTREAEPDANECSTCADVDLDGLPYDDDRDYADPHGALERLPYYDA